MQFRRVGNSGLSVSILGLGTLGWGTQVDEYGALDQLKAFHDVGGTLIDSSPIYGSGKAQELLGSSLASSKVRDRFVIASRAGVAMNAGQRIVDVSRSGLIRQLDATLATLQTSYLDLWQLDRWDTSVPLAETLSAMAFAISSGRVRHIGVSNLSAWQTMLVASEFESFGTGVSVVSSQSEYSLVQRRAEHELVPALKHQGMGQIACAPLGRGVLTGKYRTGIPADSRAAHADWEPYVSAYLGAESTRVVEAVTRAADGLGANSAHVALAWLWAHEQVASAVVGARTPNHIAELAAAVNLDIPEPIVAALDDVSREA